MITNKEVIEGAESIENEGISVNCAIDGGNVSRQIIRSAEELDSHEIIRDGWERSARKTDHKGARWG